MPLCVDMSECYPSRVPGQSGILTAQTNSLKTIRRIIPWTLSCGAVRRARASRRGQDQAQAADQLDALAGPGAFGQAGARKQGAHG